MHLVGKNVEAGVVEGLNAVYRLRCLCGNKADPKLCGENTIRHKFGLPDSVQYFGQTFFFNAIHSAVGYEVDASLSWFYNQK